MSVITETDLPQLVLYKRGKVRDISRGRATSATVF
jgi:hypothetical protein